jgi:hypothetical protein
VTQPCALVAVVFAVWFVLVALDGWLVRSKLGEWEQMEDMLNEGCQTSIRFAGLGILSAVIVVACALAFEFL